MSAEWILVVLTAVGMVVGAATSAILTSWILSSKLSNRPTFRQVKESLDGVNGRTNKAEHDYGESLRAIRTKVEQVEFWARDNLSTKAEVADNRQILRDINKRLEDLPSVVTKVDTMWDFIMDRARLEATQCGFMQRESPLTLTEQGKLAIAPFLPEVKEFCKHLPNLGTISENELELELARKFRQKLLEEVCEPNNIYMGACIVILIEALRLERVVPALAV